MESSILSSFLCIIIYFSFLQRKLQHKVYLRLWNRISLNNKLLRLSFLMVYAIKLLYMFFWYANMLNLGFNHMNINLEWFVITLSTCVNKNFHLRTVEITHRLKYILYFSFTTHWASSRPLSHSSMGLLYIHKWEASYNIPILHINLTITKMHTYAYGVEDMFNWSLLCTYMVRYCNIQCSTIRQVLTLKGASSTTRKIKFSRKYQI